MLAPLGRGAIGEAGLERESREWFEPLVQALERPALKFALMMVQDQALAEDIVQEAFTRVWASRNTPSTQDSFRRWLYRSITNVARDHYRRQRLFRKLPWMPVRPEDPGEEVERKLGDRDLALALRTLSIDERQVIYLRYYEDQSFADIALMLDRTEGSLRVMVHRALSKLRGQLKAGVLSEVLS
jgi:RNA polymerase sigma-70 factor (ECF subfamily)